MLERFQQLKQKANEEESLIDMHHVMMKEYGYIPLESFKSMPIPTVLELLDRINDYHERLERALKVKK